jgi:hypothetical protein
MAIRDGGVRSFVNTVYFSYVYTNLVSSNLVYKFVIFIVLYISILYRINSILPLYKSLQFLKAWDITWTF